jgi:predicted Fe-S protein YdhL (DUF1289 family)
MPRLDYKNCRGCGRHASEVGLLSRHRLCSDCARTIYENHNWQLHTHTGPYFERWRERVAASVGAVIPSDLEA